jgi:hypothetical protein
MHGVELACVMIPTDWRGRARPVYRPNLHGAPLVQLNQPDTCPICGFLRYEAAKSSTQARRVHNGTSWMVEMLVRRSRTPTAAAKPGQRLTGRRSPPCFTRNHAAGPTVSAPLGTCGAQGQYLSSLSTHGAQPALRPGTPTDPVTVSRALGTRNVKTWLSAAGGCAAARAASALGGDTVFRRSTPLRAGSTLERALEAGHRKGDAGHVSELRHVFHSF